MDLAGKEHASKAGDMGDNMLKSKTNSRSLYFLEQCIDVLKFNVTNSAGEIRKIPWRSSKVSQSSPPFSAEHDALVSCMGQTLTCSQGFRNKANGLRPIATLCAKGAMIVNASRRPA